MPFHFILESALSCKKVGRSSFSVFMPTFSTVEKKVFHATVGKVVRSDGTTPHNTEIMKNIVFNLRQFEKMLTTITVF